MNLIEPQRQIEIALEGNLNGNFSLRNLVPDNNPAENNEYADIYAFELAIDIEGVEKKYLHIHIDVSEYAAQSGIVTTGQLTELLPPLQVKIVNDYFKPDVHSGVAATAYINHINVDKLPMNITIINNLRKLFLGERAYKTLQIIAPEGIERWLGKVIKISGLGLLTGVGISTDYHSAMNKLLDRIAINNHTEL